MRGPGSVFTVLLLVLLAGACAGTPENAGSAPAVLSPITEAAPGEIRGRVVDAAGNPLGGVVVVVGHALGGTIVYGGGAILSAIERRAAEMPGAGKMSGAPVGRVVTGDNGTFAFTGLSDGTFTLVAVHPQAGIAIVGDVGHTQEMRLVLDRPTFVRADLSGLHSDPKWDVFNLECESPWPNVQLTLRMERDASGQHAVGPVPSGCDWRLVQRHRSSARAYEASVFSMGVSPEPGRVNVFTAGPRGALRLTGRVNGPAGEPLDDVAVLATPRAGGASRGAVTGSDGSYVIDGLEPGEYELAAVRHRLRSEIGCGNGPVDVRARQQVRIPLAAAGGGDIRVESFVRTLVPGDPAPLFAERTVDGTLFDLLDHRGKVVLIDFWATWCGVCLADMKYLARLHEELPPEKFEIVSVSLDVDHRAVERFLERQNMPWPQIVLGPAGVNPVARLYNANSTPTLILVDQQGIIAGKHIPGEQLRAEVLQLLAPAHDPAAGAR